MGRACVSSEGVSTHARHCWRARPDTTHDIRSCASVSTHARHCWRARQLISSSKVKVNLFQPTPAIAGGRDLTQAAIVQAGLLFQPTPAIAGGRDLTPARRRRWSARCFNPRPPLLAGETPWQRAPAPPAWVSTHARHCWRARLVVTGAVDCCTGFQPTPAIAGGRDTARVSERGRWAVSTHARHCWRARPRARISDRSPPASFQPTPAIAGGRDCMAPTMRTACPMFQPTPAIAGGRDRHIGQIQHARAVSTHARHCWRARRGDERHRHRGHRVSTHARHCWRARRYDVDKLLAGTSFQPTPAIAGGRDTGRLLARAAWRCFNPRPPLLAGETRIGLLSWGLNMVSTHARHCWRARRAHSRERRVPGGFNPRPPLLAGETRHASAHGARRRVSTHARHCWRARRGFAAGARIGCPVSTHARHCWRARRDKHRPCIAVRQFQPTPAIAGGRD